MWKTGSWSVRDRVTTSAVTAAINEAPKTIGLKSRWTSSSTNAKPASGALKAAASPAPAPRRNQRLALAGGDVKPLRHRRADGTPHLDGGAFPSQCQPASDGECPAEELHRDNAVPSHRAQSVQH